MIRIVLAAIAAAFVFAAPAEARSLTREEITAQFLGVELVGVEAESGTPWMECIRRNGTTVYSAMDQVDAGRLEITDAGLACFSYASANYARQSCFVVNEEAGRYTLTSPGGTFFIQSITPVRACRARRGVGV